MMRRWSWIGLALALALLVALPPSGSVAQSMVKVRYGVSPFQDTLLPVVGQEKGWYKAEGLDVQFTTLGWTEVQEALAGGSVDVAINNISSVVATHERWPQFVYWYGFNIFTAGAALLGRPGKMKSAEQIQREKGITRAAAVKLAIEQLRAKTVVTAGNTDMEQAVVGAASRAGLDWRRDFKIVDMNPDEGLAAFLSGTGDAYLGGIPQRTRAVKEGMIVIASGPDLAPPPINGIVTTKAYAQRNQETLLKLVHVWFRIVRFVDANREAGAKIVLNTLNKQTGAQMTVADFTSFWNKLENYPLNAGEVERDILSPSGYSYWKKRFDDCNWYFHTVKGVIKQAVDPNDAILFLQAHAAYVEKYGNSETGY
jgi:ABC-type nitrate/sulfonate/bicarbonate transport system substrate-binding protein